MQLKSIWTYCFDKWWRPVIFFGVTFFLFVIGGFTKSRSIEQFCSWTFLIGLLVLFTSLIYQIIRKNKRPAVYTVITIGVTLVALFFYSILLFVIDTIDGTDGFADNLKIPTTITINNPVDMSFDDKKPDSITNVSKNKLDFQLYNSFQPGLYEYDFWYSKIEKGTIYLQAFEITNDDALSKGTLKKRSSLKIYNPTDTIKKFGTTEDFTIYEGDWEKPYAARFEVWFKPDNGDKERKLFEKNYKIEGWMR